jgi:iron complex outermembrane receptor protein
MRPTGGLTGRILALTCGTALMTFAADAETINRGYEANLGDMVVTARRVERPVTDAFAGVTVIDADAIRRADASTVPELLAASEGLYVEDASGVGTSSKLNLRGFTTGMSAYHLVLVDGVPQNALNDKLVDWNLIPLSNVERIEVARGPLSTLYGENAMSGVINIITKRQSPQPESVLQAAYGSFDTARWGFRTSRTLGPVDYAVSLGQTSTDGYREHSDADYRHVAGNMGVDLGSDAYVRSWIQYSEVERGAHPWTLSETQIAEDRDQARPGTEDDTGQTHKLTAGLAYKQDLRKALSIGVTGYLRNEDGESFYTSGSSADTTAEILSEETVHGANLAFTYAPVFGHVPHTMVAGVDLERATYDYDKYAAPFQARGARQSDYEAVRERVGFYLEDEMVFGERLHVLLGARHSRLAYDFEDRLAAADQDRTLSQESYRAGISYAYRDGGAGTVFASASHAFRAPTLGQMFTYRNSNVDLEPETALNWELGIRDRMGQAVTGQANVYWMDVDDEIVYDYDASRYENYGKTSHAGVELSVEAQIHANLSGFANYTFTQARQESGAADGNDLPHVPRHMGNVGLNYADGLSWGGSLVAHWVGEAYLDDDNSAERPSYTTVDISGWYAMGRYRVFGKVANVFDEDYYTYGYVRSGENYFSPAPGTTFTTGISATF